MAGRPSLLPRALFIFYLTVDVSNSNVSDPSAAKWLILQYVRCCEVLPIIVPTPDASDPDTSVCCDDMSDPAIFLLDAIVIVICISASDAPAVDISLS